MKGRKTIEVDTMVRWANSQLLFPGHSQEHKAAICTMTERLLLNAGRYEGFYYTSDGVGEYDRGYYLK